MTGKRERSDGMSTAPTSDHPTIYGQLVRELGDVVADTRKVAEQTQAQVQEALDFRAVRRTPVIREGAGD
jgi:hypothetical protein